LKSKENQLESKHQGDLKSLHDNVHALMQSIMAKLHVEDNKELQVLHWLERIKENVNAVQMD